MRGHRWTAVAVLAAAFLATGTAEHSGIDERDTSCWDCHVAWEGAPLGSLFDVIPPERAGGAGPFDHTVQIKNPWLHEITRIHATMDLADAPSLAFYDDRPPETATAVGAITLDPADVVAGTSARPSGNVSLEVPDGASRVAVTIRPVGSPVPQDLVLRLYPGGDTGDAPAREVDEGGLDEPESWNSTADPLEVLPAGPWTIEAQVKPDEGGLPAGEVGFEVHLEAGFEAKGERSQDRVKTVSIGPGQSELVTWSLVGVPGGVPGDGETVRLVVTADVYYEHPPGKSDEDLASATKTTRIAVVPGEPGVALVADPVPQGTIRTTTGVTTASISEALGYATASLLLASLTAGGAFGKGSRRHLNRLFGSARRRVAFHNFLSYGLVLAASVHLVLFVVETQYHWTRGLIWGAGGLLSLLLLGVTGALQVPLIRRWGHPAWRWTHFGLAMAALAFTVVHVLLDGAHFGAVQEAVGWSDPLDTRDVARA